MLVWRDNEVKLFTFNIVNNNSNVLKRVHVHTFCLRIKLRSVHATCENVAHIKTLLFVFIPCKMLLHVKQDGEVVLIPVLDFK